jgi:hypothetical protein
MVILLAGRSGVEGGEIRVSMTSRMAVDLPYM